MTLWYSRMLNSIIYKQTASYIPLPSAEAVEAVEAAEESPPPPPSLRPPPAPPPRRSLQDNALSQLSVLIKLYPMFASVFGLLTTALLLLSVYDSTSTAAAVSTTVELNYTTLRGKTIAKGITGWLGIRYAAPPTGKLRFAAPQDPDHLGSINAHKHGDICLGTKSTKVRGSEDCLFLDVYAPSDVDTSKPLPVYFFIQGGGFNTNSNPNYNPSALIEAADHKMVVVTFNYRVGVYGFLASSEVLLSGSATTNNGLRDQLKALEWVNRHISKFGGNPKHVVIGGDSAGAASVALLLTQNGSEPTTLFHGAAVESVSFGPILTVNESQYQFDRLVKNAKCDSTSSKSSKSSKKYAQDTLACLRKLSTLQLQQYSRAIPYPNPEVPAKSYGTPLFMWNPVLDKELVHDYTYRSFNTGAFQQHIPVIFGDDTNGGTVFAPRTTSDIKASNQFLTEQFPHLTEAHLSQINTLYPLTGPYFSHAGKAWRRTANAYGEARYMCPNLFIATAYNKHAANTSFWSYRWNVEDPRQVDQGLGVPHTVEVNAIWGPSNTNGDSPYSYYSVTDFPTSLGAHGGETFAHFGVGKNSWVVPVVQKYWARFITDLDPNGKSSTSSKDTKKDEKKEEGKKAKDVEEEEEDDDDYDDDEADKEDKDSKNKDNKSDKGSKKKLIPPDKHHSKRSSDKSIKWDQWAVSGSTKTEKDKYTGSATGSTVTWGKRLLFDTTEAKTGMEEIDDGLKQRCEFWWSIGLELRQ